MSGTPATFQGLLDKVVGNDLEEEVFVYLDDVIIVSKTFGRHIQVVDIILGKIADAGLTINAEKCEFCRSEVTD